MLECDELIQDEKDLKRRDDSSMLLGLGVNLMLSLGVSVSGGYGMGQW